MSWKKMLTDRTEMKMECRTTYGKMLTESLLQFELIPFVKKCQNSPYNLKNIMRFYSGGLWDRLERGLQQPHQERSRRSHGGRRPPDLLVRSDALVTRPLLLLLLRSLLLLAPLNLLHGGDPLPGVDRPNGMTHRLLARLLLHTHLLPTHHTHRVPAQHQHQHMQQ